MAKGEGGPSEHGASTSPPSQPEGDGQASGDAPKTNAGTIAAKVKEIGGPKGPEPTRYGDWEKGGRCSDF